VSTPSWAGNGSKPRVAVAWDRTHSCITDVDLAQSSEVHIRYDFEGPDDLPPVDATDEVADSRRHQFFAFCQHWPRTEVLPPWISTRDVENAAKLGLVATNPSANEVLDTNSSWSGCAQRINRDDARVPIAHANAALGVTWSLAGVDPGVYVVGGYTWEPPRNEWTAPPRSGVVRIYDSRSGVSALPALALTDQSVIVYRGESLRLSGCVSADVGSTVDVAWAFAGAPGAALNWNSAAIGVPVQGNAFEYDLVVPSELLPSVSNTLISSVTVRDPSGRNYVAFNRGEMIVLNLDKPDEQTDTGATTATGDLSERDSCQITELGTSQAGALSLRVWSIALALFWFGRRRRLRFNPRATKPDASA
jgi:hypothetical protein